MNKITNNKIPGISTMVEKKTKVGENLFSLRKHDHTVCSDFYSCKKWQFSVEIFDIFLYFAQNIDCGYTLEPPH